MARRNAAPGGANLVRTALVVSAVVGIVLGLVMLFQPGATLVTIATLFGIALIVAGVFRVVWAFADGALTTGGRVALAVLGVLLLGAGVLTLLHPVSTLVFIAVVIGVSWLLSGIRDLVFGVREVRGGLRWLAIVSGIVSVLGGIAIIVLPLVALSTFAQIAGLLLVVVSVATLLTLPVRARKVR